MKPSFPPLASVQNSPSRRPVRIRRIFQLPSPIFGAPFAALALSALALLATGCTVLTYHSPTGEHFTRSSLGANTSLQSLAFEATTNGLRRVDLRGYQTDQNQALGTITEAAVKAAIQSAK
jgi:hypothetical protein